MLGAVPKHTPCCVEHGLHGLVGNVWATREYDDFRAGPLGNRPQSPMLPQQLAYVCLAGLCLCACSDGASGGAGTAPQQPDPPEISAGERLFLEGRFAQFFAENCAGFVNTPLVAGDPALDTIELGGAILPGPFAGDTFSCGVCHMVAQAETLVGGGIRTYCDFSSRSPITQRTDGMTHTPRNSPPLVNASIARAVPTLFHQDGEFATLEDLVHATLEGRNLGWLASEQALAQAHIANVIRLDDGQGTLAARYGSIPYSQLLDSNAVGVPDPFLLPAQYRIDLLTASDAQIVAAVAALVAEYTRSLIFARDANELYSGSPYDAFLLANGLPQEPAPGEVLLDYARRLLGAADALPSPVFIAAGSMHSHNQSFEFGAVELEGLRIFLRETPLGPNGGAGNCASCHPPPDFSDFGFHNAGFSQDEYDQLHGDGAFFALSVPDLPTRNANPELYLPASPSHPDALGPFRAAVDALDPSRTDLGQWNIFANAEFPAQQAAILAHIDETWGAGTSGHATSQLLPLTEAQFKTPSLRDLGHSGPYGHSGNFPTLDAVSTHYLEFSDLAILGFVRNGDPRLRDIRIIQADIARLSAFLRALNEDYE